MDLSSINIDVAQILGVVLATAVAALAQRAYVAINRHIGKTNLEALEHASPLAVGAAEELGHQLAKVNDSIPSEEKLSFATARLMDLAKMAHLKLSEQQAKTIVEGTLNQARPYLEAADLPEPVSRG